MVIPKQLTRELLYDFRNTKILKDNSYFLSQFPLKADLEDNILIKNEIEAQIRAGLEYLNGAEFEYLTSKYSLGIVKIKSIGKRLLLLNKSEVSENIFNSIQLNGDVGFEKAKIMARRVHKELNRPPLIMDKSMRTIWSAINRKSFQNKDIQSWDDFVKQVFGKSNRNNKWIGIEGLELAKSALEEFYENTGELPSVKENMMKSIADAINRKNFVEFHILTWNYLVFLTFGEIKNAAPIKKWKGINGYRLAQKNAIEFWDENKRLPKSNDRRFLGFHDAIGKGFYRDFTIQTWNDFLIDTFGESNIHYWMNEKGFVKAKQALQQFFDKYGKIPSTKDKGMRGLSEAIFKGKYKQFGINNWPDMQREVFNRVGRKSDWKWVGLEGLEQAKIIAIQFHSNFKRLPKTQDKGFLGIHKAILRGEWKRFGILNWNEFLMNVFNDSNIKYLDGKSGLEKAMKLALVFKEKNMRIPKTRDNEMDGIISAIYQKYWTEFGIYTWNDFLSYTFGRVNRKANKNYKFEIN